MNDIKNKIELIIEKSTGKNVCKNCKSFNEGTCTFGCVNERNSYGYNLGSRKITTPEYSCGNFAPTYSLNENTLDTLRDLLADIERVNEGKKNLELMLSGKITEEDFVEIMK